MIEADKTINFVAKLIKPIANFSHFLISTPLGYTILSILFIYFILAEIDKGIFRRKQFKSGGHSNFSSLSVIEAIYYGLLSVLKGLLFLSYKAAILVSIFLFLNLVIRLDKTLTDSTESFGKQQKVQEISSIAKQITKTVNIAEIKVDNVDYTNFPEIQTSLKVKFFDLLRQAYREEVQQIDFQGGELFIDLRQLNFDYSPISSPEKAIKFPTKIYSESLTQEKGIKLQLLDSIGIPYYLRKKETDIYGVNKETYVTRLKELYSWIVPSPETKLFGIRSFNLQPLHKKLTKGETITLSIDGTGEIVFNSNWIIPTKEKTKKK